MDSYLDNFSKSFLEKKCKELDEKLEKGGPGSGRKPGSHPLHNKQFKDYSSAQTEVEKIGAKKKHLTGTGSSYYHPEYGTFHVSERSVGSNDKPKKIGHIEHMG